MQFDLFSQSHSERAPQQHPALTDLVQMQALLQRWADRRWLRALDIQLPATLHQLAREPQPQWKRRTVSASAPARPTPPVSPARVSIPRPR